MTAASCRAALAAASLLALAGCDAPTARADKAELAWLEDGHAALEAHAPWVARQMKRVFAQRTAARS
jgi:hypothetical protein